MLFRIDTESKLMSIHEQIVAQVTFGIASGSLAVGELIPSVRELGAKLIVHPNTVAKAYTELERRGLIEARRGRGMEVTPEAPALCRRARIKILRERLGDVLREAMTSGVGADEVRRLVEEELAALEAASDNEGAD